jgi:hypothetical protein
MPSENSITIAVSDAYKEKLLALAKHDNRTLSAYIKNILDVHLKKYEAPDWLGFPFDPSVTYSPPVVSLDEHDEWESASTVESEIISGLREKIEELRSTTYLLCGEVSHLKQVASTLTEKVQNQEKGLDMAWQAVNYTIKQIDEQIE